MAERVIDGVLLRDMVLAGASILEQRKEEINRLNVFPVPDGDTGTNMSLTLNAAVKEIAALSTCTVDSVAQALASGSLKGARGNSGVILSQLLRGFTKQLRGLESISAQQLTASLEEGASQARKAVLKPKEGTILTVATDIAKGARQSLDQTDSVEEVLSALLIAGAKSLANTPQQLPVLKEAGVVDAGGSGLLAIYEGFYKAYIGEEIPAYSEAFDEQKLDNQPIIEKSLGEIKFGYCTEFFVQRLTAPGESVMSSLRSVIEPLGDSLVMACDDDQVKVHIHTNKPGAVLQYALNWGEIIGVKIDNMRQQNRDLMAQRDKESAAQPQNGIGVVSVAAGEGFAEIFKDLGAQVVIEGGQTMNPSMEDIYEGIRATHAKYVFVFPNNKNIMLTAIQAAEQAQQQDQQQVFVVPTLSVPQGIGGLIALNPEQSFEQNQAAVQEAIENVHCVQLTHAVRDSHMDGKSIQAGDILGIADGQLVEVGREVQDVADVAMKTLYDDAMGVITVYYGQDVSEDQAEEMQDFLEQRFEDCDVELYYGGQPLYPYVLSIE